MEPRKDCMGMAACEGSGKGKKRLVESQWAPNLRTVLVLGASDSHWYPVFEHHGNKPGGHLAERGWYVYFALRV